ncbi:MAG TPA: butyrate kinase [Bacteroidales bacterium]|nr:butyrate kinase [Bacteroidales bacterium]
MESKLILSINPGSTSTKIAIFEDSRSVFVKSIKHSTDELKEYENVIQQFSFRKQIVLKELNDAGIALEEIGIVIGRGGLLKPIPSGIYEVNPKMKEDLLSCKYGEHASNLGGLIALSIANELPQTKAYIADPVVVDELCNEARLTGLPQFERRSVFHALNQKAIARIHAKSIGKAYNELNLIVAHLGGGISIGAHSKGKVIDVNQGLDGEGPISPERSGTLPVGDLVKACFSGDYDYNTLKKMVTGEGGYVAYFGTNDAHAIELLAKEGDPKAILLQNTMGFQVSKYIGAMATVLEGKVDNILITGGIAHNKTLMEYITKRTQFIAPVVIYPGEDEMRALALNALRLLNGEEEAKEYN